MVDLNALLGRTVRAFSGCDRDETVTTGRVVGVNHHPTVLIEQPGSFPRAWAAHLVEQVEAVEAVPTAPTSPERPTREQVDETLAWWAARVELAGPLTPGSLAHHLERLATEVRGQRAELDRVHSALRHESDAHVAERTRLRIELAQQDRPDRPAFRGGHCHNEQCPCARPGLPCSEFMGNDDTLGWCPRCGWNEPAHAWAAPQPVVPRAPHQHEEWQIQESARGGRYCAACGDHLPTPPHAIPAAVARQSDADLDGRPLQPVTEALLVKAGEDLVRSIGQADHPAQYAIVDVADWLRGQLGAPGSGWPVRAALPALPSMEDALLHEHDAGLHQIAMPSCPSCPENSA